MKKWISDKSIGTKMYLIFAALVVLPLGTFGWLMLSLTGNIQLKHIQESSEQYMVQSIQNIGTSLSELDSVLNSSLRSKELLDVMKKIQYSVSTPDEKNAIRRILRNIANVRKDIECLVIVSDSDERFIYSHGDSTYSSVRGYVPRWEPELEADTEKKYRLGKTLWSGILEECPYVMGVRKIRDFENLQGLGRLYVFLKEETIREQYENLKTSSGSFFVVRDREENLVSCDNIKLQSAAGVQTPEDGFVEIQNKNYYVEELQDKSLGWSIRQFTPRSEMLRETYRMQILILSLISMLLGVLIILMYHFSRSITQPIHNLQEKMSEVRGGNFDVMARIESRDEMGELAETFNSMTGQIKSLIEQDYQSKILLQEAEYKFLRAQINPHFLYNTLDSISWMAAMGGNRDVSRMAVSLGRILRWSISNTDNFVLLKDETEILEDYLSIQQLRYGEKLNCCIDINEPELSVYVPKMILQPLAENAVVHGLESKDGEKILRVEARAEKGCLHLHIMDNGVGISADKIPKILSGQVKQKGNHGVGLYNVHRRIQLHCGEQYGISIRSCEMEGTDVHICLPVKTEV